MDYEKKEQVIFVKDLIFAALYRWRQILAVAIIFAILLGGIAAVSEYKNTQIGVPGADMQTAMDAYTEEKAALEENIERVEEQIRCQEDYLENSILTNADPYKLYRANLLVAVEAPDKTENVSSFLRAYLLYLKGKAFLKEVEEKTGISEADLNELITTEQDEQNPRNVLVTITYIDEAGAAQILESAVKYLEKAKSEIMANVGAHKLSVVTNTVYRCVDTELIDQQLQAQGRMATLKENRTLLKEQLNDLREPDVLTVVFSKKKVLLLAIIGGVLGAAVVAGMACLRHISGGKIYSARTLGNKTGLNKLGVIPPEEKKKPIDAWLAKLEGRVSDPAQKQVALATARNYCLEGKLLIAGDCTEAPEMVAKALKEKGVDVIAAGNLLEDAEIIEQLTKCDKVLLVEKCNVSRYANVMQTIALVADQNKPVIGFVLIER